ncbi:hypothetical protein [Burkholderia gladioli]|uniref:hypothetical protein n=1 Tax=Burkholderia gladioli TaxID=28095 RepID=UPI003B9873B2
MNPIEQNAAPELVPGPARITDRQVEIMTATLCEAVLNIKEYAGDDAPAATALLIRAMVKQVSKLNEAVAASNEKSIRRVSPRFLGWFRAAARRAVGRDKRSGRMPLGDK